MYYAMRASATIPTQRVYRLSDIIILYYVAMTILVLLYIYVLVDVCLIFCAVCQVSENIFILQQFLSYILCVQS